MLDETYGSAPALRPAGSAELIVERCGSCAIPSKAPEFF